MQQFSVLSYNIHECVGTDGRRDPSRIARILKESGADIIGLQEVHSDLTGGDDEELHQMDYLAKSTGFQAVAGTALQRRNGDYGNVLLTNRRIVNVRKLDLSIRGREPRGAIDADLEDVRLAIVGSVSAVGRLGRLFQVWEAHNRRKAFSRPCKE